MTFEIIQFWLVRNFNWLIGKSPLKRRKIVKPRLMPHLERKCHYSSALEEEYTYRKKNKIKCECSHLYWHAAAKGKQ